MDPANMALSYLTPHFTLGEMCASDFALRLGINNAPPAGVVTNLRRVANTLELVRAVAGLPLIVSSGFRCLALNRALKSADTSAHVKGLAADFTCPPIAVRALAERIIAAGVVFDQLIYEGTWLHIGLSIGPPRQEVLTAHFSAGTTTYTKGLAAGNGLG
jgi:zinc D-Ala-D-Ala carboxypeptidase